MFLSSPGNREESWPAVSSMPSPLQDKPVPSRRLCCLRILLLKVTMTVIIGNIAVFLYKGLGGSGGKWTIREGKRVSELQEYPKGLQHLWSRLRGKPAYPAHCIGYR